MSQILELTHLAQRNGVPQVKIGACGVDAQLDVKWRALFEFLAQIRLGDDLGSTRSDDTHLLVD